MPQFDLNLLNFQNVLIYVFCITYLFYLKEVNFYFFYFLKLPYDFILQVYWFFYKKKLYLNPLFKKVYHLLLLDFKQMKWLFSILTSKNHYSFNSFIFISLNLNWDELCTHHVVWLISFFNGLLLFFSFCMILNSHSKWLWKMKYHLLFFLFYISIMVLFFRYEIIIDVPFLNKINASFLGAYIWFNLFFLYFISKYSQPCHFSIWSDISLFLLIYVFVYFNTYFFLLNETFYSLMDLFWDQEMVFTFSEDFIFSQKSIELDLGDAKIRLSPDSSDPQGMRILEMRDKKSVSQIKTLVSSGTSSGTFFKETHLVDNVLPKAKRLHIKSAAKHVLTNHDSEMQSNNFFLPKDQLNEIVKLFTDHDSEIQTKVKKNAANTVDYIKNIKPHFEWDDCYNVFNQVSKRNDLTSISEACDLQKAKLFKEKIFLINQSQNHINFNKNQMKEMFSSPQQASICLLDFLLNYRKSFYGDSYFFLPSIRIENHVWHVPVDAVAVHPAAFDFLLNPVKVKTFLSECSIDEFNYFVKNNFILIEFKVQTTKKQIPFNSVDLLSILNRYPQANHVVVLNNNPTFDFKNLSFGINKLDAAEKKSSLFQDGQTNMFFQQAKKNYTNKSLWNDLKYLGLKLDKGDPSNALKYLSGNELYQYHVKNQLQDSIDFLNQPSLDKTCQESNRHLHKVSDVSYTDSPKYKTRKYGCLGTLIPFDFNGVVFTKDLDHFFVKSLQTDRVNDAMNKHFELSFEQTEMLNNSIIEIVKKKTEQYIVQSKLLVINK